MGGRKRGGTTQPCPYAKCDLQVLVRPRSHSDGEFEIELTQTEHHGPKRENAGTVRFNGLTQGPYRITCRHTSRPACWDPVADLDIRLGPTDRKKTVRFKPRARVNQLTPTLAASGATHRFDPATRDEAPLTLTLGLNQTAPAIPYAGDGRLRWDHDRLALFTDVGCTAALPLAGAREAAIASADLVAGTTLWARGSAEGVMQLRLSLDDPTGDIGRHHEVDDAAQVEVEVEQIPSLCALVDADRDGVVDAEPPHHDEWEWGADGNGAILAVKTRGYDAGDVHERSELALEWRGEYEAGWAATLEVDHADRIGIYRSQAHDAPLLLGGAQAGPLDLAADVAIAGALGDGERVRLFMEAPAYPTQTDETAWTVTVTCRFTPNGGAERTQRFVLRIAPWIMANDLDPSDRVWLRVTDGVDEPLPAAIRGWVGGSARTFPVAAHLPSKGFARDVMKSGYVAAPHYSGVAIQRNLDAASPLSPMPARAATEHGSAGTFVPTLMGGEQLGQDNGGNLLVSPPSDEFPWGRILYGGNDDPFVCHSAEFYAAQRLQRPIRLDSTWLRVGHVDEMLSFVRCSDGSHKALLMSPRLALLMLEGVSRWAGGDADAIIAWAEQQNAAWLANPVYDQPTLDGLLAGRPARVALPPAPITFHAALPYQANPAVPAADRFVVLRTEELSDGTQLGGTHPGINGARGDDRLYELRAHARRFLETDPSPLAFTTAVQGRLDAARATLRAELGMADADIIDVPVLLKAEMGYIVALTPDSVNALVLRDGAGSRCLVPKPFGPVYGGQYVFERYLDQRLDALPGVTAQFLCDDAFHVMEGEIHCGTNQIHTPLQDAAQRWWEWDEPA